MFSTLKKSSTCFVTMQDSVLEVSEQKEYFGGGVVKTSFTPSIKSNGLSVSDFFDKQSFLKKLNSSSYLF